MISPAAIDAATARIAGQVARTPLLDVSHAAGRALLLKCENLQVAGSFKYRGATSMITNLTPQQLAAGVITYSSGNHAQAVACAARARGVPAVVVMPRTAPAIKVAGARGYGAEVLLEGTTSAERRARAEREAARRGLTMVPPFDHPDIIAGQATVGREIVADAPDVSRVYVPVGGGGLLSGVAAAIKRARPAVRVVGVEPAGAACMAASLAAGRPVTLDATASVADGLLPVRPGDLTFAVTRGARGRGRYGDRRCHHQRAGLAVPPGEAGGGAERRSRLRSRARRRAGPVRRRLRGRRERRQHRPAGPRGADRPRTAASYCRSAAMSARAASIAAAVVATSPSSCRS